MYLLPRIVADGNVSRVGLGDVVVSVGVPVDLALADVRALVQPENHRLVAMPKHAFEDLKIGAGPPPRRQTWAPGW